MANMRPVTTEGRMRRCSLCGTLNLRGVEACVACGTYLTAWDVERQHGWRAMLGDRPASGARALLALPFFLLAALAAGALGVMPLVGIVALLSGTSFLEAFQLWAVLTFFALVVMFAAAGLAFLIRGRED